MELPLQKIRTEMRGLAGLAQLPFRHQTWRGQTGQMLGTGTGSSLDFQDHRPYFPGDDPRGINWQAYARTGVYTMKLYRDEVSPRLDLIMDASASMFLDQTKAICSARLLYFCLESALLHGASVRLYLLTAAGVCLVQPEEFDTLDLSGDNGGQNAADIPPNLTPAAWLPQIPVRMGSLRVWITDLLFESAPDTILPHLINNRGRGLIFSPFSIGESEPDWTGNTEFIDAESPTRRHQNVTGSLLRDYKSSYARHFELWKLHSRKLGIALTRIHAERPLRDELVRNALPQGAVELLA
ncbi:DUF58 domain-containing protein [Kamptonema cortianum]|nr:DUF58 domain-containing protein [Oscillatoria laete-virens]MDK3155355.1 DUF58 domain-containing protein [Kamptonema cortianum]MDL5052806.1 DUF58 domain-containing protein [Oscillatoria laete-virens NRMC-F 0139]